MSETAILLKHYRLLAKNIESLSDGQARLKTADEDTDQDDDDSLTTIHITLVPRSGPYRGGVFDFELDLSDGYPTSPPVVHSLTPMYHPNVDCFCDYSEGDVCLNLLDELWNPDMTLDDVVQGLLFLLHEPNLEDPLNSMFDGSEEEEEFRKNVRKSLRGGCEINGVSFERNLVDGYESEDEEEEESKAAPANQDSNEPDEEAVIIEAQTETTQTNSPEAELDDTPLHTPTNGPFVPPTPPPPPPLPSYLTEIPQASSPPAFLATESSVDREQSSTLFSQSRVTFNGFDKMWTLSLNSIIRTIVLGTQTLFPSRRLSHRHFSSSVDVR